MEEDNSFKWLMIMFICIILWGAIGSSIEGYLKHKTTQTAIEAGLVQDSKGNWVEK